MASIRVTKVEIQNNPAKFTDNFKLEVEFECVADLKEDVEWKLVYVGSGTSVEHDQELDSILVGPIKVGTSRFVFDAPGPNPEKIPKDDIVGAAAFFLSGSYKNKEFVRVGYYISNEYTEEELKQNPPEKPDVSKLQRNILLDKPRMTTFPVQWDESNELEMPEPTGEDEVDDDEELI